ncbi:MAG: GntR family transcriptional regulator, partial [Betaproteobacteria bacterium]|nr:GntR family transcriptional regulator [Betaproteobacteria bacterium]
MNARKVKSVGASEDPISEAEQQAAALLVLKPQFLMREQGPLYRQLATRLREPIDAGLLLPGSALPKEATLAAEFGVSLITVRQALRDLEGGGLIKKRTAKAAVVASPQQASKSLEFQSFAAIAASSVDRRLVIKSYRKELSVLACEVFSLPPRTLCYCLRALLLRNEQPITQSTFYFPPAIGSRLKRADFDDVVVFRAVQRHLGIQLSRAQIKVRAELADEALALVLDCAPGAAILAMEMLYYASSGEPVELTLSKNRG